MVSHWGLSVSKSLQVSRTLLSILPDFNNAVVWMVFTRPLISKSFSPCTNPLVNIPSAPIIIGITVTFMFYSFLSFRFLSILLGGLPGRLNPLFRWFSLFFFFFFFFFFCCWLSLDLVVWQRLDDSFVSQNPIEVCASYFLGQILVCIYIIC